MARDSRNSKGWRAETDGKSGEWPHVSSPHYNLKLRSDGLDGQSSIIKRLISAVHATCALRFSRDWTALHFFQHLGLDQERAGFDATQHLLESSGNVAFAVGFRDARAKERLAGYRRALETVGLDPEGKVFGIDKPSTISLGGEIMSMIVSGGKLPEAIFCIDDNVALGVVQQCRNLGISVPQDILIIGFHDLEFAAWSSPSLSSVRTNRYKLGQMAAEATLEALPANRAKPMTIDVGYEIVQRQSSRRS